MKKISLVFFYILLAVAIVNAQKDTTRIKLGDTKIIIIDNQGNNYDSKLEKLEKGKEKFEKLIEEKEKEKENTLKELELLQKQLKEPKDEEILKKLEEALVKQEALRLDLEKELKALEKGVKDIEREIEKEDWKKDWKEEDDDFDWDMNSDWYSDWDNLSPFNKKKKFRGHWSGFELGLNNYVNEDYKTTLDPEDQLFELNPEQSWVFSLNFVEFNIPFSKWSGLVTGMGTTWNNYHFRNNVNVYEDANAIIVAEQETDHNYSKNTLNLWYMTVPLIFEFQIPVSKNRPGIHVGFGVVGSLKLTSKMKQKYDGNKTKTKSDFQIPGLKYGLTFRIGYRFIKLFANYDLVPLFKENRGPKVFPVSAGIILISF